MRLRSHRRAGARSSVNTSHRCQRLAPCASAMIHRRAAAACEADCALGIEAEVDALADLEIRQTPRLWQCHPKFEAAVLHAEQHGGIRAVEEQALHCAAKARMRVGQPLRL